MPGATTLDSPPPSASSSASELGFVADAVTLGAPESRVLIIATGMCIDVNAALSLKQCHEGLYRIRVTVTN